LYTTLRILVFLVTASLPQELFLISSLRARHFTFPTRTLILLTVLLLDSLVLAGCLSSSYLQERKDNNIIGFATNILDTMYRKDRPIFTHNEGKWPLTARHKDSHEKETQGGYEGLGFTHPETYQY